VLDAATLTPDDVLAATTAVLAEPRYRDASARLQAEIASLPSTEDALALLEQLHAQQSEKARKRAPR
jgi:UDP:flavonoid glycosyltransferase YjiC (YdhE family)